MDKMDPLKLGTKQACHVSPTCVLGEKERPKKKKETHKQINKIEINLKVSSQDSLHLPLSSGVKTMVVPGSL